MYRPAGEFVADRIFQGDIFDDFPCFWMPAPDDVKFLRGGAEGTGDFFSEAELPGGRGPEEAVLLRARRHKIIVVSQSCDVHEERFKNLYLGEAEEYDHPFILYSPVIPIAELANYPRIQKSAQDQKKIQNQNLPGSVFYLEAHPDNLFPESVAYTHWVCSIKKTKENRFRTFSP